MRKWIYLTASGFFLLTGFILVWLGSLRTVNLFYNGVQTPIQTRAFTVSGALRSVGIEPLSSDLLQPGKYRIIGWNASIYLTRAVPFSAAIAFTPYQYYGVSADRIPANLLFRSGIPLYPGDEVRVNGVLVNPAQPLLPESSYALMVQRATPVLKIQANTQDLVYSAAPDPVHFLWQNSQMVQLADLQWRFNRDVASAGMVVQINSSHPVVWKVNEQFIHSFSSESFSEEALSKAGFTLQGLDRLSLPLIGAEPGTEIKLSRVQETVALTQTVLPFEKEYVEDPETELGQTHILQDGAYGLQVKQERICWEDGLEVSRVMDGEWLAVEPKPQRVGKGTKIVLKTIDTPGGPLEYWAAIPVYATSYSPCNIGIEGKCSSSTSLGLPVQRGVIGVTRIWYSQLAGQSVYVPGYGKAIVADIGGGIPGKNWIDLGFTDAEYESWHHNTTLYLLAPAPAVIPGFLP